MEHIISCNFCNCSRDGWWAILSPDGLGNQTLGLHSWSHVDPGGWLWLGWLGEKAKQRNEQGGAGKGPRWEASSFFYKETLKFENYVQTYSDFQHNRLPETFLMLNILGKSYIPWLLPAVREEVKCATVKGSFLFWAASTSRGYFLSSGQVSVWQRH